MKARIVLVLALILVLVLASSASVAASGATVPFKATYVTHPGSPVFDPTTGILRVAIPAEGQATHLGNSTWYSEMWVDTTPPFPLPPMPFIQGGEMTFTAANGAELSGTFEGFAIPNPTGTEFWGTYEITGGTGRLSGTTGDGRYWGAVVGTEGMLYFDGMLYKPIK
jgi:hypothetical protein